MNETKAASAVVISASGFGISIGQAILWVQLVAGIVAILSGLAATYYYLRKASR